VTDPRIEQIRSYILTEVDLPPREDWMATIDPAMPEVPFAVDDEWVLTVAVHRGHSREIGIDVEAEITWALRWQDRLMERWEMYMSVEAALEAVRS
jgi:hypothetical protein